MKDARPAAHLWEAALIGALRKRKSAAGTTDTLDMDDMRTAAGRATPPLMPERRKSKREPLVTVGHVHPVDDPAPDRVKQVLVCNVSLHGVGFRAPQAFDAGGQYCIRIGAGPLQLSARFRVISSRSRRDGLFDVGGQFV